MQARCKACGRAIETDPRGEWEHEDKRVKAHVAYPGEEETNDVMEVVLPALDQGNGEEKEEDASGEEARNTFGKPKKEDMVTVRGGGLYLTARRRIGWLRGEPRAHPEWTIDTQPEEVERGKFISSSKVEGGYARIRADLFDETGRLISTGVKTEWSERFMDFYEKAETGAIARCLAVAGFGTEAALDLDEGYEQDRIADAPVQDARPIIIKASNVPGLIQGGRSRHITAAQLNEIQRLIGQAAMGMTLVPFIEGVLGTTMPELGDDPTATIMAFLKEMTFSEAALVIQALNKAVSDGDTLRRRRTDKRSRRPVARRRSQAGYTRSAPGDNGVADIGSNGRNGWRGDPR